MMVTHVIIMFNTRQTCGKGGTRVKMAVIRLLAEDCSHSGTETIHFNEEFFVRVRRLKKRGRSKEVL